MGLLDDLKGKAQQVIGGNERAIKDGIEKAGDFVDSKTGGKHADKIDAMQRGASGFVDKANEKPNTAPVADRTPVADEPPAAGEDRRPGL
ncbi:antitoxin [Arthrobacter sp. AL08]|uniref:antitoxin n=2 Tax=Micrococcales TaxID=85006 RepID=UPI00249C7316|nr:MULTISPECIES: antitoxin [Micrococcaceae]MDI3241578.1 antitoxin [Arthrobacter sp. AL05]MDI3277588.1 antitoxin [Arthrobacter sp. AL08]MDJ0353530.1 antitoxin [Pseudarthrobacter sp. PH31-O2]WGZ80642.1 antitoxin [Arthrobacter sp. EM1]